MLNNRKIRLMTKLAIYENEEGKEDIALSRYFRRDFLRLRTLLTLLTVTVGYAIVIGLTLLYNMEYFVANAVTLDYVKLGTYIVVIYVCVLFVYMMACLIYNMAKYNKSRKKLSKYFRMLRLMRSFYAEEEQDFEEDSDYDNE